MTVVAAESPIPLPLLRRGKVRDVYVVDDARLLLVASDRVSAFDVVMAERFRTRAPFSRSSPRGGSEPSGRWCRITC